MTTAPFAGSHLRTHGVSHHQAHEIGAGFNVKNWSSP